VPPDLNEIRRAFCDGRYLPTIHALEQLLERHISLAQVDSAICEDSPEIIEDYIGDLRGPSCLIFGWGDLVRPLHMQVGYAPPGLAALPTLITVYEPDPAKWRNYRERF
jgi:hypothetical protein